jgi:hypothetical protein
MKDSFDKKIDLLNDIFLPAADFTNAIKEFATIEQMTRFTNKLNRCALQEKMVP